jgi:hypothetical protein
MTQNNSDFIDYLGGLETKTSPSTKKEIDGTYAAVLGKAGLKRKVSGTKKFGRVLLIAAAVAACTAISAAAAGTNLGEMFGSYFKLGGPYSTNGLGTASAALTSSQMKMLNQTGSTLSLSAASNGTTVTVSAVVGDKSNAYILLDVTAPKGTKLNRNDYTFAFRTDDTKEMELLEKGGAKIADHKSSESYNYTTLKDADPTDNKIRIVMNLNCSGVDLRGKEVRLNLKDLAVRGDAGVGYKEIPVIKGEWRFTVPLDYAKPSKELPVNRITRFKPYVGSNASSSVREKASHEECRWTVKSISLSSFSATAVLTGNQATAKEYTGLIPPAITIHLKDGSQADMMAGPGFEDASGTERTSSYLLNAPIDVGSVSSVTIGDVTVPVS